MGLLGMATRTAVIAGTATAVSGRVARRQRRRWDQQDYADQPVSPSAQPGYVAMQPQQPYAAPQPVAPAAGGDQLTVELQRLAGLKDQGLLTDDEFTAAKAKLLGI